MDDRAVPSLHGRALGVELARLADSQVAAHPDIDERCLTCAFREGTMTNSMAPTLLEAVNCVVGIDDAMFGCHHGLKDGKPTKICAGYVLCMMAPAKERLAAVERAHHALKALGINDDDKTHDQDFLAWQHGHDPDRQLDDYQLARAYAKHRASL